MNILLINLTRFGDLLQMQPVILGLQAQGHKVGLVCLENFAGATALLRGLDFVLPLAGGSVLRQMGEDWHKALAIPETMAKHIEEHFPVDYIINTTAILGARLLARRFALEARARLGHDAPIGGFGLDADGFGVSGDMWSTFLQGASAERLNCPFNLVDMFRSSAGLGAHTPLRGLAKPSQAVLEATDTVLQEKTEHIQKNTHTDTHIKGFVGFQLGASDARRQWPVRYFAELGAKLWQELGLCPILLGTQAERHLAEEYAALHAQEIHAEHPFMDAVGSTDIIHLAGLLARCSLLITNDTGTMHLAAGLEIPVVAIFLATAQAWDTGPYLPHCVCLEPDMPCHPCAFHKPCIFKEDAAQENTPQPCLTRIKAQHVFALVAHYRENGTWPELVQQEVRVWQTLEDTAPASHGFATLESLSGHAEEERTKWLMLQRAFYRQFLDGKEFSAATLPQGIEFSAAFIQETGRVLRQTSELLLLLQGQLELVQKMPSPKFKQNVLATCQRIQMVLHGSKYLKAMEHLWRVLSQEQGGNVEHFTLLVRTLKEALDYLLRAVLQHETI